MSSVSLPPVPIYGPSYFLFIISSVSPSRVSWLYSRCPSLVLSIYSVFCPMFPVGCYICHSGLLRSLWSCLCSIKNQFVKEFHVSSFCAGPGAHRVRSVPAAHRVRSVPTAHRVRSVPAAHRVRSVPAAHRVRSVPAAHRVRSVPAAHRVRSVPAAHRVRSVPAAHRVRSVPAAHRVRSVPAAHRVRSVPAAHRVRSVPAAHRVCSVPAAHRVINGLHMSLLQAFFYEHPHKHVLLHYIVVRNVLKRTVRSFFLSAIKHANNIQYLHKNLCC